MAQVTAQLRDIVADAPLLMGVVNITPDSFSDGGQFYDAPAAVSQGRKLLSQGAAILDLGAEASSFFRAGVVPVPAEEQSRRLLPVVHQLVKDPEPGGRVPLVSVDTRSAEVARAAVAAGAHMINDISAGTHDPDMYATIAELGVPFVLMHMGESFPETPAQDDPAIIKRVRDNLLARADAAIAAGVNRDQIALDPGIGFGKTMADNWRLVRDIHHLLATGFPIVLGVSRKRFLATAPPEELLLPPLPIGTNFSDAHERDPLTARITRLTADRGVQIHRVHNVALAAQALAKL